MSHAGLSNKKNEDASYDVEAAALSGGSAAFRPLAGVCAGGVQVVFYVCRGGVVFVMFVCFMHVCTSC